LHIDYGFISFKGEVLSTRKGNMVLASDVIDEARKRVAKIIKEKNPDLANKEKVIHAVSVGALKYYDLSHNRRSDFEFDWDEALDFEGNSGPYLQYAYARLSSILNKVRHQGSHDLAGVKISATERQLILKSLMLAEVVGESLKDYLPNLLANYLYELAGLIAKFYHESPIMKEEDEKLKFLRLSLVQAARITLGKGLTLLGIEPLEEM
jgi:arginyl-tRNA synthetase